MSSFFRASVPVLATVLVFACSPVKTPSTDGGDDIDAAAVVDGGGGVIDAISIDAEPVDPCGGDAVLFEDAEACYREAMCSMYVRCYGMFATVDECLSYTFGRLNPEVMFDRFEDSMDADKMTYDPAATARCFAAMRDTDCALFEDGPPDDACDQVFGGTVTEDNTCFMSEECAGSNPRCDQGDCELQCCAGSCEAAAALLQSCATRNCEEGAHCVSSGAAGTICQSGEAGTLCHSSYQCDAEFWCDLSGVLGVCTADFPPGSSCSDDKQCPAPQLCVGDDTSAGIGVCAEVSTLNAQCDNECYGPRYCHATDDELGTCRALPGLGSSCAVSNRCLGTLRCDNNSDFCITRMAVDGVCQNTNDCQLGLICDASLPGQTAPGQCKNPVPNGSACFNDEQCVSQICAGTGGALSCQAYVSCY